MPQANGRPQKITQMVSSDSLHHGLTPTGCTSGEPSLCAPPSTADASRSTWWPGERWNGAIAFFLAMLSQRLKRVAHVAKAQTATSALAAQIRSQGFACDEPQKATRDVKLSKPDYDVWVLML